MSAPSTEDERCPRCDRRECNIGRVGLNRPETRGDYVGCVSNVVDWRQRYLATHQKLSDARAALRPLQELLAYAVLVHPMPWRIDQDWTKEVLDRNGDCVAKFMTVAEAQELIDAAMALKTAQSTDEQVEAFINGDDRALTTPAPVAVPATHDGSQCAHGNEDCGICT